MLMKKIALFISLSLLTIGFLYGKSNNDSTACFLKQVNISATLESMHFWRGNASADMPTVSSRLNLFFGNKQQFNLGVWGASSIGKELSGVHYKEIDYFFIYRYQNFTLGLWDQFSMKGLAHPNIFDYKENTTTHYVDAEMTYFFGQKFPLKIQADVAIYGNDYETNVAGGRSRRYSTYLEGRYRLVVSPKIAVEPFVGIATALNGRTMGYGNGSNNFDLVNIGVATTKEISLFDRRFPIKTTIFWNPAQKIARFQLSVNLF